MKTTFKSEQQIEGEKEIEIVEDQYQGQMVGPSDAEAAVVEATGQRKETGLKREKTRAEKDKHNAACRESREKIKRRREYLEKLDKEVVPELEAENQVLKSELGKQISKTQLLEDEIKKLKADKEQAAKQEQMMRQIFTMIRTPDGQTFSSPEECEAWFLSQNYAQLFQGSVFTNITASDAGPSVPANPDYTTLLGVLNINLFSPDLAAGTLSNPDPGSSSGADRGMPVLDEKDVDQCISEMLGDPDP